MLWYQNRLMTMTTKTLSFTIAPIQTHATRRVMSMFCNISPDISKIVAALSTWPLLLIDHELCRIIQSYESRLMDLINP